MNGEWKGGKDMNKNTELRKTLHKIVKESHNARKYCLYQDFYIKLKQIYLTNYNKKPERILMTDLASLGKEMATVRIEYGEDECMKMIKKTYSLISRDFGDDKGIKPCN